MTNVLFLCPHAAGKSLMAATYFRAAASRLGLDVEVSVAGPSPDPVSMPNVVDALTKQGFRIDWPPQLVTAEIAAGADLVVSVGCRPADIPPSKTLIEWDVPSISDGLPASMLAIHSNAEALAAELAAAG